MNKITVEYNKEKDQFDVTPEAEGTAKLEETMQSPGFLDSITNFKLIDVPIGQALIGGAGASVLHNAGRRFASQFDAMWVDSLLALVVSKFGKKYLGDKAADAVSMFLLWDAFGSYIDEPISKAINPPAATTDISRDIFNAMNGAPAGAGMKTDYYQGLGGR